VRADLNAIDSPRFTDFWNLLCFKSVVRAQSITFLLRLQSCLAMGVNEAYWTEPGGEASLNAENKEFIA
jgi:hypothetical protein